MKVTPATVQDIPALVTLLNSAYRGEASKKGWTTEAGLVGGELRTDEVAMRELFQAPGAIFLKYLNDAGEIGGCVFLQQKENKLYLGMLSVSPTLQAKGTGRLLMNAAEVYAREKGCGSIFMRVISLRHELIAWYERLGYHKTGIFEPFPGDTRFGRPLQPLEFEIMEKHIQP